MSPADPRLVRLACLFSVLVPCLLFAQAGREARRDLRQIYGTVRFATTGLPARGAVVTLSRDAGEVIQQTATDLSGRFQFENLEARIYYVTGQLAGHEPAQARIDLSGIPRQQAYLSLRSRGSEAGQQVTSTQPTVPARILVIPERARKEFERGTKMMARREKEAFQSSLEHFRKAIALYPEYYEAHHMMGLVEMDLGQWDEAMSSLKKSIEIQPEYAPSYFALGTIYNSRKEFSEAEKSLTRGLELDPKSWMGHLELAKTYFGAGLFPQAEDHARQAHELNPAQPACHLVLANVLLGKHDASGALTEFEHYLDRQPDGPVAEQVRDRVKKLRAVAPTRH